MASLSLCLDISNIYIYIYICYIYTQCPAHRQRRSEVVNGDETEQKKEHRVMGRGAGGERKIKGRYIKQETYIDWSDEQEGENERGELEGIG